MENGVPSLDIVKYQFSESHLRGQLDRIQSENSELVQKIRAAQQQSEELKVQSELISTLTREELRLKHEAEQASRRIEELLLEIQELKTAHRKEVSMLQLLHKTKLASANAENQSLVSQLEEVKQYMAERGEFLQTIEELNEELEAEKGSHKIELQELCAAQIRATTRIRREVQEQLRETKLSLFKLNDQQLEESTRLTIFENQKLNSEVEFLSKEAERLVEKNSKLEAQVVKMRKDIDIHKQTEYELVKRTKAYEKLLAEMSQKIEDLEKTKVPVSKEMCSDDAVESLERQVADLTAKLAAALREGERLKKRGVSLGKAAMVIMAVLGDYIDSRASGGSSDSFQDLLKQDFTSLSEAQKRDLALCFLCEAHRYFREAPQPPVSLSLPPMFSPKVFSVSSSHAMGEKQLSSLFNKKPAAKLSTSTRSSSIVSKSDAYKPKLQLVRTERPVAGLLY